MATDRTHPDRELVCSGPVAVPTVQTAVSTTDTYLEQLYVCNISSSSVTLTVTNAGGTPVIPTSIIQPNAFVLVNWAALLKCIGGIKWQASASGLTGELFGFVNAS